MLAHARRLLRVRGENAQRIALDRALHMVALPVPGVGLVKAEDRPFPDGEPLQRAALAGGGLPGELPVAQNLGGQAAGKAGASVLQVAAEQVGGDQQVFRLRPGQRQLPGLIQVLPLRQRLVQVTAAPHVQGLAAEYLHHAYAQFRRQAVEQRDVGQALAALPLAHCLVCDIQALGQLGLRQAQGIPPLGEKVPCLCQIHWISPLRICL